MDRHNNVFLNDTIESYNFKLSPKQGPELKIPHIVNLTGHRDKLLMQLRDAQAKFAQYTPKQVAAIKYHNGTYIEFSGATNCDLLTQSLEDVRHGIKLLNVRDIVTESDDNKYETVTKATVFIPQGKESIFIKKIQDFASQRTKSGKPKNNDLISSIESISNAIKISAFWIGRPSEMPDELLRWYELWISVSEDDFDNEKELVFKSLDDLNIEHRPSNEFIHFPERLVVLVHANCSQLLDYINQGVPIAEIRKPANPNAYFMDTSLEEQTAWAEDLLKRTTFNDSGVAICILDTGVNNNHPLIAPYMPLAPMTVNNSWGSADHLGHGTNMAGIALYNCLKRYLISSKSFQINHTVESVKLLEGNSPTPTSLYGYVTEQAVILPSISNPEVKRIYCMAITDATSSTNDGQPSSWSGALDNIIYKNKQLFITSVGNAGASDIKKFGYPEVCLNKSAEDPSQAWNTLSVGAYTIDADIRPSETTKNYYALAQVDELSPYSSSSYSWSQQWPIKPDVVCDGGNVASNGTDVQEGLDELSKLTLSNAISRRLFDSINGTSAATAQCANIAAQLLVAYPNITAETLRGLIIHSARWTDAMKNQFCESDKKSQGRKKLLRVCGYGVPNLQRAMYTYDNCVNMIIEEDIQPFEKTPGSSPKMKEMHIHSIPWPTEVLQELENTPVNIRLTLSYFIEPAPGERGWNNKYRYSSCGLRFDIIRPNETLEKFRQRINAAMRDDDYAGSSRLNNNWFLGPKNRDVGSIHSDVWSDTAINISKSNYIAVYPVIGWWRERANLKKYNTKVKYSLIITIETPQAETDLYNPIMTKIANRVAVPIEIGDDER